MRILGDAAPMTTSATRFAGDLTAAEVRYLIEHEWAQTADDVLWRRSKLGLTASAEETRRAGRVHGGAAAGEPARMVNKSLTEARAIASADFSGLPYLRALIRAGDCLPRADLLMPMSAKTLESRFALAKVLVVDDEQYMRKVVRTLLMSIGVQHDL